jgi:hypothetical protein
LSCDRMSGLTEKLKGKGEYLPGEWHSLVQNALQNFAVICVIQDMIKDHKDYVTPVVKVFQ